jgi:hypothetical protein
MKPVLHMNQTDHCVIPLLTHLLCPRNFHCEFENRMATRFSEVCPTHLTNSFSPTNPYFDHKTTADHNIHKMLVLMSVIIPLILIVLQLTTIRKYSAIHFSFTKLRDPENYPLIRRSRGGKILPSMTRDKMARTSPEVTTTVSAHRTCI